MNTNSGEVVTVPADLEMPKDHLGMGQVVKIVGFPEARWRVTGMKPNGRLFLKLVKASK